MIQEKDLSAKNSTIKAKVRPAQITDFDKVYPLLEIMNSTRLSKDDWFRLFENHWSIDEFSPGIVLEAGDDIVGYIGTIYSYQIIEGKEQLFCNLTTWIVQDEYRSYSIMMILPLVRKKNVVLTSFSSNDVTYEVYKKLGFKDGNQSKRIVYPFPSFQANKFQIITNVDIINKSISLENKKLFDDHKCFGNAYILVKYEKDECLIMGVSRKEQLKIYSVSNKSFFQKNLKHIRSRLLSIFQVKRIQIDEHLLNGSALFFSRKVTWGNPYQYKSKIGFLELPTPEYTELFLLNM